jgi:hypothetical protein
MPDPAPESIRLAMDQAWRDHHHARDQTWKAVQMEAVLAAGLLTVDVQYAKGLATSASAVLVILAAVFGILITLHHRTVEITKFRHITNCQRALKLDRPNLISGIAPPAELRLRDAFRPSVRNTASFILRLHVALILFAVLVAVARWTT